MQRLRDRHLRLFSKALLKLHKMEEPERIHERLVECVATLTSGEYVTCEIVDPANNVHRATCNVQLSNHEAYFKRLGELVHQNPIVQFVQKGGHRDVLSPYDLMPKREFQRTDLFNDGFRPVGIDHQLVALIPKRGIVMGVLTNRMGNFKQEDRTVLQLVRPHLMKAYETAQFVLRLQESGLSVANPAELVEKGLTRREIEVLHWLRQGKADREIGIILGISHRTVHHHVAAILYKLGVKTRMAAVRTTFGSS